MKTKDIWQLEGICGTIIFESCGRSGAEKKCRKRKNEKVEKEEMYNILVCDDDKEIVEAIEIYLTQDGHQVLEAYDGIEAVRYLKKRKCRSSRLWIS